MKRRSVFGEGWLVVGERGSVRRREKVGFVGERMSAREGRPTREKPVRGNRW